MYENFEVVQVITRKLCTLVLQEQQADAKRELDVAEQRVSSTKRSVQLVAAEVHSTLTTALGFLLHYI